MNDQIRHLVRYLEETLGIRVVAERWADEEKLPRHLRQRYMCFTVRMVSDLFSIDSLVMFDVDEEEQAPSTIEKHMAGVMSRYGGDVVYVRNAVTSWNRKRMIEHRIPFIVPGNQMYLPMLGIDLREHMKRLKTKKEVFSPSTQVLVLYTLLNRIYRALTPGSMSRHLGYTPMTMTRSFDQLEAAGIGKHARKGRERSIRFDCTGEKLWKELLPYLGSPVRSRIHIASGVSTQDGMIAGETALAHCTELSEPANPVMAIGTKQWKTLKDERSIKSISFSEPEAVLVEVWKYPPEKLSASGSVDALSLFLSLKESRDERIQSALDDLITRVEW